jgi:hypothetical protein
VNDNLLLGFKIGSQKNFPTHASRPCARAFLRRLFVFQANAFLVLRHIFILQSIDLLLAEALRSFSTTTAGRDWGKKRDSFCISLAHAKSDLLKSSIFDTPPRIQLDHQRMIIFAYF